MAFPGFDTPKYGTIGGALPWGGGVPAPIGGAGNIAASYNAAYNNALAMNQGNYNNILAGYQQAIAQYSTAQQAIQAGYSNLYNQVLNQVKDIGAARRNEIGSSYEKALASGSQTLIDRGLGNSTIQMSLQRGVESDRQRALTQLSDDQAKMLGDYMSQLGLAGLKNQSEGLGGATGLVLSQLGWMNSMNAAYPDAGLYGQLAQMSAMGQGGPNRNPGYGFGGGSFAGVPGPSQQLGYVPGPGPTYGSGFAPQSAPSGGQPYWMANLGGGENWNVPNGSYAAAPAGGMAGGLMGDFYGGMAGAGSFGDGFGSMAAGLYG